jgi:hypothetical protein
VSVPRPVAPPAPPGAAVRAAERHEVCDPDPSAEVLFAPGAEEPMRAELRLERLVDREDRARRPVRRELLL